MKSIRGRTSRFCTVFLFVAIIFLQPIIDVRADVSAQGKEVLEAVDKVAQPSRKSPKNFGTCPKFHFWKPSRPFI